jgi:type I restriction-modification system DNA methylase subunit
MAKSRTTSKAKKNDGATVGYEAQLWQMADALRGSMDAAEPFAEKMKRLVATLREQQAEAAKLDAAIVANLKELGFGG